MTIRSRFFDSTAGDRVYTSDAWKEIFQRIVGEGYVKEATANSLKVTEASPTSMKVKVDLGVAWIQGRFFEVHTTAEELTLANSDPTNPRDDRIVARLSYTNRTITLAVLTGNPAVTPVAPALTRNANTYEISLAKVRVGATVTQIVNANITDEREDATVCGRALAVVGPKASAVTYDGSPTISATTVEGALDELDAEKQALSGKGVANGYGSLNGSAKQPVGELASEAARKDTAQTFTADQTVASDKNVFLGDSGTLYQTVDGRVFFMRNAWFDGTSWARRRAENNAARLWFEGSSGDLIFDAASDAGNTVGSAITWAERFRISKAGVMTLNGKVVSEGAVDSGGAGFRVLRVPNN